MTAQQEAAQKVPPTTDIVASPDAKHVGDASSLSQCNPRCMRMVLLPVATTMGLRDCAERLGDASKLGVPKALWRNLCR